MLSDYCKNNKILLNIDKIDDQINDLIDFIQWKSRKYMYKSHNISRIHFIKFLVNFHHEQYNKILILNINKKS